MENFRENFKVTLDRIEEGNAVLLVRDDESVKINIPLFLLPAESKEGDILDITITRDVQETEDAKERVSGLLEKLKNKNQGTK
ncbi:Protein of unknown function [Methanosarcina thermophila]|jgi:hypothetical protein|uniref:DUF3006 domain-containing protein n=3 Tax=Methanosarcina thermophila TaxID=2210 RepID=A0A1I7B066_METTE|nr:DUF3006 domain-containing protein [Methanosarcina thermophila]ALK05068.1 MAG: hypothetical protein AAY43_04325 [Methanosarcina sp. 795]AKB13811.1 hypothetical protein MSTHT_2053 [Methanosarcina thermophila TM-1]AKB15550.1 hypothetical protein MSTHC_1232 [Methanosarcina thermophila CHTI-55]NLU57883.1 DUF3006 domain-containing protein [Methanosarcina thermophila]SFT80484.1 Protein of unknown function [Methanosarcina thermophila]